MGQPVNRRISFIMYSGAFIVIALMWLSGHPPAQAQHQQAPLSTVGVVSDRDETQDLAINNLTKDANAFMQQQRDWNAQTGAQIGVLTKRADTSEAHQNHFDGAIEGGIYFSGAMTFIAAFFQLRKNRKES